jgi:CGNR zinc finger
MPPDMVDAFFRFFVGGEADDSSVLSTVADIVFFRILAAVRASRARSRNASTDCARSDAGRDGEYLGFDDRDYGARLFLDTTRSRTRRWCDMRSCGDRNKVGRFREA